MADQTARRLRQLRSALLADELADFLVDDSASGLEIVAGAMDCDVAVPAKKYLYSLCDILG